MKIGWLARNCSGPGIPAKNTFERLTGVTPHQYILRARLRAAALGLASRADTILDIALQCGFGDLSNFNRAFRAEFGITPRAYRLRSR
jgi:AraC family transcriptional regulator